MGRYGEISREVGERRDPLCASDEPALTQRPLCRALPPLRRILGVVVGFRFFVHTRAGPEVPSELRAPGQRAPAGSGAVPLQAQQAALSSTEPKDAARLHAADGLHRNKRDDKWNLGFAFPSISAPIIAFPG